MANQVFEPTPKHFDLLRKGEAKGDVVKTIKYLGE